MKKSCRKFVLLILFIFLFAYPISFSFSKKVTTRIGAHSSVEKNRSPNLDSVRYANNNLYRKEFETPNGRIVWVEPYVYLDSLIVYIQSNPQKILHLRTDCPTFVPENCISYYIGEIVNIKYRLCAFCAQHRKVYVDAIDTVRYYYKKRGR